MADSFKIGEAFVEFSTRGAEALRTSLDRERKSTERESRFASDAARKSLQERSRAARELAAIDREETNERRRSRSEEARAFLAGAGTAAAGAALRGAKIADPAGFDKISYEKDRLLAALGSEGSGLIGLFGDTLGKVTDLFTDKQLFAAKFSDASSLRDRLQVEALRGVADDAKKEEGDGAKAVGAGVWEAMQEKDNARGGPDRKWLHGGDF